MRSKFEIWSWIFNNYSCKMFSFLFLYTTRWWLNYKSKHVTDYLILNIELFDGRLLLFYCYYNIMDWITSNFKKNYEIRSFITLFTTACLRHVFEEILSLKIFACDWNTMSWTYMDEWSLSAFLFSEVNKGELSVSVYSYFGSCRTRYSPHCT